MANKQAPWGVVKGEFGSKEKLAAQLVSVLDVPEGQSKDQFQRSLQRLSCANLLKLKRREDLFKSRFGGRAEKAVEAIVARRNLTGAAAEAFKAKAASLSRGQLLDLAGPPAKG